MPINWYKEPKMSKLMNSPLPPELGGSNEAGSVAEVTQFLKENVPLSDQKEIQGEFAKSLPLGKQAKKKIKQGKPVKKAKYLTAREKRNLGNI